MAVPARAHPVRPAAEPRVEVAPGVLSEAARRFAANRLAVVGLVVAAVIVFAAAFADLIAPYPRDFADFAAILEFPSREHPLGTDAVGRDFLSRVLHGARTSMIIGLSVPILATLIGVPLGALAGWRGGRFDYLFLRVVEIMTALPNYIVAVLLVMVWGSGLDKMSSTSPASAGSAGGGSRAPSSCRSSSATTCWPPERWARPTGG
jgi:oligopeptide transport system permease protein